MVVVEHHRVGAEVEQNRFRSSSGAPVAQPCVAGNDERIFL